MTSHRRKAGDFSPGTRYKGRATVTSFRLDGVKVRLRQGVNTGVLWSTVQQALKLPAFAHLEPDVEPVPLTPLQAGMMVVGPSIEADVKRIRQDIDERMMEKLKAEMKNTSAPLLVSHPGGLWTDSEEEEEPGRKLVDIPDEEWGAAKKVTPLEMPLHGELEPQTEQTTRVIPSPEEFLRMVELEDGKE